MCNNIHNIKHVYDVQTTSGGKLMHFLLLLIRFSEFWLPIFPTQRKYNELSWGLLILTLLRHKIK